MPDFDLSNGLRWPSTTVHRRRQDYRLDGEVLLPYDLKASSAHATMLQKIGVLQAEETRRVDGVLGWGCGEGGQILLSMWLVL